jgi:4-amino-4-deoxy-L-arabinose transferase-like glycosyltransferase
MRLQEDAESETLKRLIMPALFRALASRSSFVGVACATLLAIGATAAWTATAGKNATADEPLHALGAFMRTFHDDFRLNPQDPPLWGYWAMIPQSRDSLKVDTSLPEWRDLLVDIARQWKWGTITLFHTPQNDPEAFINRSRAMMLVIAVALGAAICGWSWQLGGSVAAIVATALYALDPNFLGHAALVKNDIPLTLVMLVMCWALWLAGERLTFIRALVAMLLLAAGLNVKFAGVTLVPIFVLVLLARAILPRPWIIPQGRIVTSRAGRLGVAAVLTLFAAVVSLTTIWACYRFRYTPTPDPIERLNMRLIARAAGRTQMQSTRPSHDPTDAEMDSHPPTLFTRTILYADEHRLLPQAFLAGLLDTYATTFVRPSFLLGEYRTTGWWYYFPLAMLFKTPLATLGAFAGAIVVAVALRASRASVGVDPWSLLCLLIPLALYGYFAIGSNLNVGLRHLFPLYPLLFILTALAAAKLGSLRPRLACLAAATLLLGLSLETARAHPNYIAFFNSVVGGPRGGFDLLGDSNLDWGQDLKLLQKWQHANPHVKLYVAYFGMADPMYYLKATLLPGSWGTLSEPELPRQPGVIAVSASTLQGTHLNPQLRAMYESLRMDQQPIDVLGGTFYLYPFPASARGSLPLK